jgi:phasin family protein
MFKNLEDLQKFSKDQFDAAAVSTTAWSKGVQQIATEATDFSKKSFEASTGLFEKLAGVKTLDKAMEIQTEFAKQVYESFVAQATKFGEIYSSMAKDAYKPVEDAFAKAQAAAK